MDSFDEITKIILIFFGQLKFTVVFKIKIIFVSPELHECNFTRKNIRVINIKKATM